MAYHDKVARLIAKKNNTEYNKGKGPDIKARGRTIEVESKESVNEAGRQLSGYKGLAYVAGTDMEATDAAKVRYKDSTIGVMNSKGKVVQPAKRRK